MGNMRRCRHSVTFLREEDARSASGEMRRQWVVFATVAGRFEPERSKERFARQQETSARRGVVHVRYKPEFDESCRVEFDGRTFDVLDVVDHEGRKRWIELPVEEVS